MGCRVIWAHAAEADLDAAAEYIHRGSPAYEQARNDLSAFAQFLEQVSSEA